jgi:uncharacterized OB-fold protein/acyl dehydratase
MIRHWAEAMGDTNPVYTDPEAAAASVHGGIVAPPSMLQAWIMRGLAPPPATGGDLQNELLRLLDSAGFSSVVATNSESEYLRYLRPGDNLTLTSVIDSISDEKKTGLGVGHFVTMRYEYTDQTGELVGTMRWSILKFRPAARAQAEPSPAEAEPPAQVRPPRPRPPVTRDTAFWFEGAKAGQLLIQRCASCGTLRHPPGPACPACLSYEWDTQVASGRGTVYSFVVNHYPKVPAFDYPLPVGLIELEEGVRVVADLTGVEPADVRVGMPVTVEFVAVDDELTLPMFRPAAVPAGVPA